MGGLLVVFGRIPRSDGRGSLHDFLAAHWDHEPSDWSAGLRHGAFPPIIGPCRRPALPFMESIK
jgi:hypothetical protein